MNVQILPHEEMILRGILVQFQFLQNHPVWIFGSRAKGTARKYSDLDLLFGEGLTLEQISEIREALENSNLLFKVDLVREEDLAPAYKDEVHTSRVLFQGTTRV